MAKRKRRARRPRLTRAGLPSTGTATVRYVESSALVAALVESDQKARAAIASRTPKVASALTFAEAARALIRLRNAGVLTPEQDRRAVRALRRVQRGCYVVAITQEVLDRVGRPFPVEPIRTLDAVHLATAEFVGEPPQLITVVTRDQRVRANALALGYSIE